LIGINMRPVGHAPNGPCWVSSREVRNVGLRDRTPAKISRTSPILLEVRHPLMAQAARDRGQFVIVMLTPHGERIR
jgi:hypothetical protein